MTSTDEALSLLANAREGLMHAEGNHRIGFYRPAVSLAYYAAFYAAQAVVAYHRDSPKTHKGTRDRFWYRAVAHSDFPPQVASIVNILSTDRLKADYDHATMQGWSENDAAKAIRPARRFVTEVDEWFNRHYPDTSGESLTDHARSRTGRLTRQNRSVKQQGAETRTRMYLRQTLVIQPVGPARRRFRRPPLRHRGRRGCRGGRLR